jgi:insulysin
LDALTEFSYDASLAGLGFQLEFTSKGIQLIFSGYNDKFLTFAQKVLNDLKHFKPSKDTFNRFRDILYRELSAWKTQQPYQHSTYFANLISETLQFPNEELKIALEKSSLESLDGFISNSLKESFGTSLIIGVYILDLFTLFIFFLRSIFKLFDCIYVFAYVFFNFLFSSKGN